MHWALLTTRCASLICMNLWQNTIIVEILDIEACAGNGTFLTRTERGLYGAGVQTWISSVASLGAPVLKI